jgi:hypothetical protein
MRAETKLHVRGPTKHQNARQSDGRKKSRLHDSTLTPFDLGDFLASLGLRMPLIATVEGAVACDGAVSSLEGAAGGFWTKDAVGGGGAGAGAMAVVEAGAGVGAGARAGATAGAGGEGGGSTGAS